MTASLICLFNVFDYMVRHDMSIPVSIGRVVESAKCVRAFSRSLSGIEWRIGPSQPRPDPAFSQTTLFSRARLP